MTVDLILLLSGPIAVGKTTVRKQFITDEAFDYVRSGAYLASLSERDKSEGGRRSLQELGDALDTSTDFRWIVDDVALPGIHGSPDVRRWLVDAVRKERQVAHFRELFGAAVTHLHLTAPDEVLLARYNARASDEQTPYEQAIDHANERASRALHAVADLTLSTADLNPVEIVKQTMFWVRNRRE